MIGYTLKGDNVDPDSYECYARETETSVKEYFVRTDRKKGGLLYDPTDKNFDTRKVIGGTGIEWFPFVEVSQTCFDLYLSFLRTGKRAFLLNASRNVQD